MEIDLDVGSVFASEGRVYMVQELWRGTGKAMQIDAVCIGDAGADDWIVVTHEPQFVGFRHLLLVANNGQQFNNNTDNVDWKQVQRYKFLPIGDTGTGATIHFGTVKTEKREVDIGRGKMEIEFLDPSELGEPIGIYPSLQGAMEFTIKYDTRLPEQANEFITEMSDMDFLNWIHDRLQFIFKESPNIDYMHKLKQLAERMNPLKREV